MRRGCLQCVHVGLMILAWAPRLSAPLARHAVGVAASTRDIHDRLGATRVPGRLNCRALLALRGGGRVGGRVAAGAASGGGGSSSGGFKYMEDRSRIPAEPEPGAEEEADSDSAALGSSELEDEYLLSDGAGDGDDHVLSSLPDEAKDDYEPSAASGDDQLNDASVHSLDAHGQAAVGDANMRDDPPGGASASTSADEAEDASDGAEAPAHGRGAAGGLVAAVEVLNGQLLNASRAGDVSLIRQLVAQGASPNAVTPMEKDQEFCHVAMRPLHLAAAGGHLEAYQALVSLGAAVRTEAGTGETELHFAAEHGHADVVRTLLDTASFGFCADDAGCGNASGSSSTSVSSLSACAVGCE